MFSDFEEAVNVESYKLTLGISTTYTKWNKNSSGKTVGTAIGIGVAFLAVLLAAIYIFFCQQKKKEQVQVNRKHDITSQKDGFISKQPVVI